MTGMIGSEPQSGDLLEASAPVATPTGIPRLDEIMGGGLPNRALALIVGPPGSGKTTIASQIAFHAARNGKTALILTALSEPTGKLVAHLGSFSFFDRSFIGGAVQFISVQSLLAQGLRATGEALVAEARRVKADIVVLDGFQGFRVSERAERDPESAREFLYTLGATLSALGATTIVTSEADPRDPTYFPECATADVIIGLHYRLRGMRQHRGVEIIKARAHAPLPGVHTLALDGDGASVFPQLEARVAAEMSGAGSAHTRGDGSAANGDSAQGSAPARRRRATFGLPALDAMLHGGLPAQTCALLVGGMGAGKTLLAIAYALAGVRAGERVVFLGFRETRQQLLQAIEAFDFGAELARALAPGGGLTFIEMAPFNLNADILADRLLGEIDRVGAQRVVIDGVSEVEQAILHGSDPERLHDYLAALLTALRARSVTSLFLRESDSAPSALLDVSADALSTRSPLAILAENMLLVEQTPVGGKLHRVFSVVKMRFSDHDTSLRELRIAAPAGVQALESSSSLHQELAHAVNDHDDAPLPPRHHARQAKHADTRGAAHD